MADYLHRCLELHPATTKARYGKVQRLDRVEQAVREVLDDSGDLWQVVVAIDRSEDFDADMFGVLPDLERALKEQDWYAKWQKLPRHQLIAKLYAVYRQIEPASMVLRFAMPERYGIFSPPVASLLGIRPRRRQKDTYATFLESLDLLRQARGLERIADVEMALWALQVGVLDSLLQVDDRDELAKAHRGDTQLRRMQTRNLTTQIFAEWPKLTLAEALCEDRPDLAGQIAGIEFEQLVVKWAGCDRSLKAAIDESLAPRDKKQYLHRARRIRNRAVHEPQNAKPKDVRKLIAAARWVQGLLSR